MAICDLLPVSPTKFFCDNCGRFFEPRDPKARRACKPPENQTPMSPETAAVLASLPRRETAEIINILGTICGNCEHNNDGKCGQMSGCCNTLSKKVPLLSNHCPLAKW